ncbi:MAG: phenylacetate--CoA ligase family protein [Planctomycetota bacterium]|nr:MAG: phenylacetate--CoA ligase family protein [Planctomycetota bacterium]
MRPWWRLFPFPNRDELQRAQRERLAALIDRVRASNPFYQRKLAGVAFDARRDPLEQLPLTTRDELQADQAANPPFGTNLSFPLDQYNRFHQTSGSTGEAPLRWLDTPESWSWWKRCWSAVFAAADVDPGDRVMFPFSFGPFVGFWSAFDAAVDLGCLCFPGGGLNTAARVRQILEHGATVVCCTPTYALHMAQTAEASGLSLADSDVRRVIVAGEPGGNIPATRTAIETSWGARACDHAGMTEIGAWGFEDAAAPGALIVNEAEFMAEVIDPETGVPRAEGEEGELVLTNLGRLGSPLIRYRTGDVVRLTRDHDGPPLARAVGGVRGRVDDLLFIRGNNVFPSAIEGILRDVTGVAEFRICVEQRGALRDLTLEIEATPSVEQVRLAEVIADAVRERLCFRPTVRVVPPGTLPRFELKARRVVVRPAGEGNHPPQRSES